MSSSSTPAPQLDLVDSVHAALNKVLKARIVRQKARMEADFAFERYEEVRNKWEQAASAAVGALFELDEAIRRLNELDKDRSDAAIKPPSDQL